MTQLRELYRSSSGDRWSLILASEGGPARVRHEANGASGGAVQELEVGDFLTRGGNGPEKQELLRLIGELVEPAGSSPEATEDDWMSSYDHPDDDQRYESLTDPGADPTTG